LITKAAFLTLYLKRFGYGVVKMEIANTQNASYQNQWFDHAGFAS